MRTMATVLGVLAIVFLAVGDVAYFYSTNLSCADLMKPCLTAQDVVGAGIATIGPGLTLALITWLLSLSLTRAGGHSKAFIVTLTAPLILIAAAALYLFLLSGSLTPIPAASQPDVSDIGGALTHSQVISPDWINATAASALLLAIWPLVSVITARLRPLRVYM